MIHRYLLFHLPPPPSGTPPPGRRGIEILYLLNIEILYLLNIEILIYLITRPKGTSFNP